jgi:hypothetical protein
MEGSGSVPLPNGSGFGRPINIWIRNTVSKDKDLDPKLWISNTVLWIRYLPTELLLIKTDVFLHILVESLDINRKYISKTSRHHLLGRYGTVAYSTALSVSLFFFVQISVADPNPDPNPPNPHVFGPPGFFCH